MISASMHGGKPGGGGGGPPPSSGGGGGFFSRRLSEDKTDLPPFTLSQSQG